MPSSSRPSRASPGEQARYRRLGALLARYVSALTIAAVLRTARSHRGLQEEAVTVAELPELVEECMKGLRVFCAPERLPALMLELADFCEHEALDTGA